MIDRQRENVNPYLLIGRTRQVRRFSSRAACQTVSLKPLMPPAAKAIVSLFTHTVAKL